MDDFKEICITKFLQNKIELQNNVPSIFEIKQIVTLNMSLAQSEPLNSQESMMQRKQQFILCL